MYTLAQAIAALSVEHPPKGTEKVFARFAAHRLAIPETASIVLDDPQAQFLQREPGNVTVWLVVKDDPQSVFFDPLSGDFGACWGPDETDGSYRDLGIRSNSAFDAYRS